MKSNHSYKRIVVRHWWLIGLLVGMGCLVTAVIYILTIVFGHQKNIPVGLVFASDPVSLFYFDTGRTSLTVLTIPADTHVGDGAYTLDSLWHLGAIDPKDEKRLQQTLQRAFGAPILWYVGATSSNLHPATDHVFSLSSLFSFITGRYRTNMTFAEFIRLYLAERSISSDRIKRIDVRKTSAIISQPLADGTYAPALDTNRIDSLFSKVFEDSLIRRESLSIAIYNTTEKPLLGSGMARELEHVGMVVTVVGNQNGPIDGCEISATQKILESKTAVFIQKIYGCRAKTNAIPQRADIEIRLGNQI